MTGIRLQTLGGLRVTLDGRELRELPAQPVRCALLVYLAVERGATRDELMTLLCCCGRSAIRSAPGGR